VYIIVYSILSFIKKKIVKKLNECETMIDVNIQNYVTQKTIDVWLNPRLNLKYLILKHNSYNLLQLPVDWSLRFLYVYKFEL